MPCYVRLMRKEDVAQVTEIDREAFPTQSAPNYERELRNQLAHYIVACNEKGTIDRTEVKAFPDKGLTGLVSRLRQLFSGNDCSSNELPPPSEDYVVGFAGFWVVADEGHLTSIAVREAYRQQGIGELLLMSFIDQALALKVHVATLEVRVSNTAAQNLYAKYGFTQVGIRRGYYLDNKEDAWIMSTQDITLAPFQTRFQQLKQAHASKYGTALNQVVR